MVWYIGDKTIDDNDKDIEYVYDEKTLEIYDVLYKGVSLSNTKEIKKLTSAKTSS